MSWIEAIEQAPDLRRARQILSHLPTWEDGKAFFEAVRSLLGQDFDRAYNLSAKWRVLSNSEATMDWALRTRAVHEKLEGRWLASAKSFLASAEHTKTEQDRLIFQIGAIDCLGKLGRVKQAEKLSRELASDLRKLGCDTEAAAALLNGGNALLWHDQYKEARRNYSQALDLLSSNPDSPFIPAVLMGLSTAELYGGHPRQAIEYASQAEEVFEVRGDAEHRTLARQNRAVATQLLGDLDGALHILLEIRDATSSNSLERARAEEQLGDVYFKMSLYQESMDAYSAAVSNPQIKKSLLNMGNSLTGQGTASLALTDFASAESQLKRARAAYRSFGNPVWEGHALANLGRLYLQQGKPDQAFGHLKKAIELLTKWGATSLRAEAQLDMCDCLLALKKDPVSLANSSLKLLRKSHHLLPMWRVYFVLARANQGSKRLRYYRQMLKKIWAARSLTSSLISRASFLSDKAHAISLFMGELLEKQTPANIEEAQNIIRESRSVALLEEILAATKAPASVMKQIESLREELNLAINNDSNSGTSRQTYYSTVEIAKLQRKWIEATCEIKSKHVEPKSDELWPDIVLVDAGRSSYSLSKAHVYTHSKNIREIAEELAWFRFELLEPMANPSCDATRAMNSLEAIAKSVWTPTEGNSEGTITICPDGNYWKIPWQLLAVSKVCCEAVLCVGPWANRAQDTLPPNPKAMIWYHATPDLPNISAEAETFLKRFPDAIVCQTIGEVRDSLKSGNYDILHVASHANFHHTNPMFSSLSFGGGKITAAEISRSQLRVNQVVLSACETGAVSVQHRAEPEGLVRSFLAKGAKSILASSWPLDDQIAEKFMYNFYESLLNGQSFAQSVSVARKEVRAQKPHPYYWGCFTLFGGYSS